MHRQRVIATCYHYTILCGLGAQLISCQPVSNDMILNQCFYVNTDVVFGCFVQVSWVNTSLTLDLKVTLMKNFQNRWKGVNIFPEILLSKLKIKLWLLFSSIMFLLYFSFPLLCINCCLVNIPWFVVCAICKYTSKHWTNQSSLMTLCAHSLLASTCNEFNRLIIFYSTTNLVFRVRAFLQDNKCFTCILRFAYTSWCNAFKRR